MDQLFVETISTKLAVFSCGTGSPGRRKWQGFIQATPAFLIEARCSQASLTVGQRALPCPKSLLTMTSSSDPLQNARVSFVLAVLHAGSSLHVQISSECNMRLLLSQFCFWYLEALPPKCRPFLLSCWH